MGLLLLIVLILILFGAVGYNQWGPNGLGGALGFVLLIILLLAVFDRLPLHGYC